MTINMIGSINNIFIAMFQYVSSLLPMKNYVIFCKMQLVHRLGTYYIDPKTHETHICTEPGLV